MTEYEDLSHREVVERVKTVEDELEELKGSFRLFKKQIQKKI